MSDLTEVSVRRFREALNGQEYVGVDDDFCIVNIEPGDYGTRLDKPFRFESKRIHRNENRRMSWLRIRISVCRKAW